MGSNRPAARNQRAKLAADLNDLFKDLQSSQVKVVGNYHLGQVIGQGTYGKVKLATHALTGQQVAVKVVAKSHASIITREIYHWRCLSHPNIAHLHEVLTTESKIYLVTEYCPNGELLEALIRDGRCKPSLAKRWFRQICLAVQYCHLRKIVHRDLKLENILLDSQNNIKLIDFGFTRECESKKLLESYCGSAAYTAPEIIVGKKYSGPEADIWSLGVILYTLLAGYLPFDDDNEAVVQDKIIDLDYEMPTDIICKDAQDLIQGILKEDPKERLSIEQILNHSWWTPRSDDDEEGAENDEHVAEEQDFNVGGPHHGRQGSLTKREIHPVLSTQRPTDMFYGSGSPQLVSPLAQHPYGAWGSQSPYTFNPLGDNLKSSFSGAPSVPSPLVSPLPSPSPMVNKSFPRHESGADGSQIGRAASTGTFPTNAFEQRLLLALSKIGFDQEIFTKGVPSQSCDPGYGLWCLLIDQVRQKAIDNGTTVEWEQSIALMDATSFAGASATGVYPNSAQSILENGKRSPRPMSDPSPTTSQTNLLLPLASLHQQQQQQQQEHADLQQQTVELKLQLDQYKLETELLKVEKHQLEKEKMRLAELNESKVHPFEAKELPPITNKVESSGGPNYTPRSERPVQDSGVSVSTSSTPHSSWELAERDGPAIPLDRPRRKSKGILHSLKDRFFSAASDVESNNSAAPSPYPPSPIPPKGLVGSTASASSSTSSATTYVTSMTPKPLPAPPAHPYSSHLLQQYAAQSPLSGVSYKSASTSSLAMETGHATRTTISSPKLTASSDNLVIEDSPADPDVTPTSQKNKGFMSWITESASGTVLNKSPVAQNPAKVPKRINARSFSSAETIPVPSTSSDTLISSPEEARPQIPAIPASFFQPIWKPPSNHGSSSSLSSNGGVSTSSLATSAPTMTFRQRIASFSSSSAKITPEERQRAVAAAAAAAALVAQPALPERAHSPSPPSSPRGSGGSGAYSTIASAQQSEISDIVAAAVAATASAHLKSSGSRKKNSGLHSSSSKKSKSQEKTSRSSISSSSSTLTSQHSDVHSIASAVHLPQPSGSSKKQSSSSLLIPSPSTIGSPTKELSSKDVARKPSIKSSKASMPSLMTAFSSFKPSRSVPSSPLVQQPPKLPIQEEPLPQNTSYHSQIKTMKDGKSSRYEDPLTSPRLTSNFSMKSSVAMTPYSTRSIDESKATDQPFESTESVRTFGDGVVIHEEVRPKKRTTSRTSITAASIGRKSSESVASGIDRTDPPSPHATITSSAVSPSKRASLGSMSSRRSSSSSMRDRNIFGLTLDSTGSGSRKSSLNLSRASLSKSTFQSPTVSPAPRRGVEMDRERGNYGHMSRTSQEETYPGSGAPTPTAGPDNGVREHTLQSGSAISMVYDKSQDVLRSSQGQHSRSGSSQEAKESIRRDKSPMHAPSPTLQPRGLVLTTLNGSTSVDTGAPLANSSVVSSSLSASSSSTTVAIAEKERKSGSLRRGEADTGITTNTEGDDPSFSSDAPRLDFADGCSLIPSPPPSPTPPTGSSMRTSGLAIPGNPNQLHERSQVMLEQPKVNLLSTSYPPPRTSFSYTQTSVLASDDLSPAGAHQDSTSPPLPSRPLVSFDQHFSNQDKIREYRDSTPRKVVTGFQPLAAKRLSKPGLPNNSASTAAGDVPALPGQPGQPLSQESTAGTVSNRPPSSSSFSSTTGPPNAFAGRRRGYRNSTGSMANMTLQQQQNFQQLQREQLLRIQQNQHQPNAGYEATAAMKINPRPRTGLFPKREYGGATLGGLGGHNNQGSSPVGSDHTYEGASGTGGAKRESYSSRRQSMAVAMGKRPGAAPAAIQEEEE
ncbi:hypothetical protein BGX26_008153 [Mortierella sp. AD094]|nr:hypothetical protein BGX26_008153 [Mortierella sp. AD094]